MKMKLFFILIIVFWTLPLLAQGVDTTWVRRYYEEANRNDLSRDVAVQSKFKTLREGERGLSKERRFEKDQFERYGHPSRRGEATPFHPAEPFNLTPEDLPAEGRLPIYQPAGGFRNIPTEMGLPGIMDDFLVNDDTTGGSSHLSYPAIAQNSAGSFIITWVDTRNVYPDVYAQRYDPFGIPLDSNFKVNEISLGLDWGGYAPTVAIDDFGNFVITWINYVGGDVYAQRYNSAGIALGANFIVNDELASDQFTPAIAMDGSGNFIITWEDHRNGNANADIYAQRYDSSGTPLGSNFKVNDDAGTASQADPDIAMDGFGNFAITWHDYRNGNYDIYAQRYDFSGTPLGSNFKVNDDAETASQGHPAIAMNDSGNFTVTWSDRRNDNGDIYGQRYDSSGTPLGSNFKVNDDVGTASQFWPDIAMDGSCNFVIVWYDNHNDNYDIYAQRYDSSGAPLDSNFKVNDDTGTATQYYPTIGADASGDFVICWLDFRHLGLTYAQRYDSLGTPLGSNFKVNDDVGSTSQRYSAIGAGGSGNFVITWEDWRNYNWDIYAQRYDSLGTPLGSNFKVNDDTGTDLQERPDVAVDGSRNFVIVWKDNRNDNFDIYCQRYDSSGTALGSNFKVNDAEWGNYPAVAMDDSGNFVITWYGSQDIYAQRYSSSGTPLGSNFMVNDVTTDLQFLPDIAMDEVGNFVITWEDDRNEQQYSTDIYAQRYDSAGNPLGANFRVNSDSPGGDQLSPAIAMDGSGNFVITWWDFHIFAQRYDSSGTPLDSNFRVSGDHPERPYPRYPLAVAMDDSGYFTIAWYAWYSHLAGWYYSNVYAQTYYPSGEPMTSNYLVTNPQYVAFCQEYPGVAVNGSNIYFAWQDNRRAKGWDIYANIKSFTPPDLFSLLFPRNKAFTPRKVRFDWETATDPNPSDSVRYDLYVSTSYHQFLDSATVDSNLVASEYMKILNYGAYYWRVKAKDNYGAERWSNQIRSFMVTGIHASLGDFNGDGSIDVGDVVFLINYLFISGPAPDPQKLGDVNCDDEVNSADVVFLINYLFNNGPSPSC
jgi:hypothetical protein